LVAEKGERVAGYRGTVALNVIVPNPSLEIALVALDLWATSASFEERQQPIARTLSGSSIRGESRPTAGHCTWLAAAEAALFTGWFNSSLRCPTTRKRSRCRSGPTNRDHMATRHCQENRTWCSPLSSQRVSVEQVVTRLDTDTELPLPVESGLNFENEPVQPDRVIPVGAQLDDAVVGRDICVLSVEVRPSWFFLQLGGSGDLRLGADPAPDRGLVETTKHLMSRWSVEDDRGGQYRARSRGAHSGWPWTVDAAEVELS
jgi:hypothetical protein